MADDQAVPATHGLLDIQSQEVQWLLEDDEKICAKCRRVLKHRHFEAYTDPLGCKWPHRQWCRRCCIMHSGNMTLGEAIHLILKEIDQAAILNKACLQDTLEQMKTQVDDTLSRLEISRGHDNEMRTIQHYAKQVSDAHKEIQLLCAPLANQLSDKHKEIRDAHEEIRDLCRRHSHKMKEHDADMLKSQEKIQWTVRSMVEMAEVSWLSKMNPIEELKQQKQILELRITEMQAEIDRRRSTIVDDLGNRCTAEAA